MSSPTRVSCKSAADFYRLVGNDFFSVEFVKKDGTLRKMNARCKVAKYVKGTGKALMPPDLVVVWEPKSARDSGEEAYRSFRVTQVLNLRVKGQDYNLRTS